MKTNINRLTTFIFLFIFLFSSIPLFSPSVSATVTRTGFSETGQHGRCYNRYEATWNATIIDSIPYYVSDTTVVTTYSNPASGIILSRGFLFFDTSALPDDLTITRVNISFPVLSAAYQTCNWYIQASNAGTTLQKKDYYYGNFSYVFANYTWGGGTGAVNVSLNLNLTHAINASGLSDFVIRLYYDYASVTPGAGDWGFDCTAEENIKLWVDYTLPIQSKVNPIIPYTRNEKPITVTTFGASTLTNVSLFYRYSRDNTSDWWTGTNDSLNISLADGILQAEEALLSYPQRLWYDEDNQLLYVACAASSTLLVYDVSEHWDLTKLEDYTSAAYIGGLHDIKVINNWSYGGRYYGNIVLALGGNTNFSTLRYNISSTIGFLDSYAIGTLGGYLDYFVNATGHLIVFTTRMENPGRLNVLDCSDPTNIVNLTQIQTQNQYPWYPYVIDGGDKLVISYTGAANMTPTIYDITTVGTPVYINPVYALGNNYEMLVMYPSYDDTKMYAVQRHTVATTWSKLIVYDITNPINWVVLDYIYINRTNGEWQLDLVSNEWAAFRYYIAGVATNVVTFYNVKNVYNMYYAGNYTSTTYVDDPHMHWFDMKNRRCFVIDYTKNSLMALNTTFNLTRNESWMYYGNDAVYPWSWSFSCPNGTGYYEFSTIAWVAGVANETHEVDPDARMRYVPAKPTGLGVTSYTTVAINLNWTNGVDTDATVLSYKVGNYPTTPDDGTILYNGTGVTLGHAGLTANSKYFYRAWGWNETSKMYSPDYEQLYQFTKPTVPTGIGNVSYGSGASLVLNITWTPGTGNRTIIRKGTGIHPTTINDGVGVYNGTTPNYYNGSLAMTDRFTLFTFGNKSGYSTTGVDITFYMFYINVYNESSGLAIRNWNVFITNESGTAIYQKDNCNNSLVVSTGSMPTGEGCTVTLSHANYTTRVYTLAIENTGSYTIYGYLARIFMPHEECDPTVFMDSRIIVPDGTAEWITLTHRMHSVVQVEAYNKTLEMWVLVPTDKWTNYSANETVAVNAAFLPTGCNISMARITYYYLSCYEVNTTFSYLYLFTVNTNANVPAQGALLTVKQEVGGVYVPVTSGYCDGAGQFSTYLIPGSAYKVFLNKTGYYNATSDYIPSTALFTKTLVIYQIYSNITVIPVWSEVTTFEGYRDNTTMRVYTNFTDTLGNTTVWTLWFYQVYGGSSTLLATFTGTNDTFQLWTAIINNTYDYHVVILQNSTTFGSHTHDFWIWGYHRGIMSTPIRMNTLFTMVFSYCPIGWQNLAMLIISIACFFSFGRRETYMAVMLLGGILLFLNFYIGFETALSVLAGGAFPVILIVLGLLMLVRDRGMSIQQGG